MPKKLSKQEIIAKANDKHGCGTYDYSMFEDDISYRTLAQIGCKKHGDFQQKPYVHLAGHGCPECVFSNKSKPQIKLYQLLKNAALI